MGETERPVKKNIGVIIADRHPRVRSEIQKLLTSVAGLEVVGLAANGAEAVDLASRAGAELLLLDMELEHPPALDVVRLIRTAGHPLSILALCSECGSDYVSTLLSLGVDACMMKEDGPGLLPTAIRQVVGGTRGLITPVSADQ